MSIPEILGLIFGVIGTGIAIYQTAVINESKKRKHELQYLLAGINAAANQKQMAWQNQISMLNPTTKEEFEVAQVYVRARDDITEVATLSSALEGTIDSNNSAILSMMDKYKVITDKSNEVSENAPPMPETPKNTNM
ncbi:hypothetical protein KO527_06900 [Pseudoalteromonas sp. C2R02]|jgi:BMFP domain-containing protein YqiC|uniref:hypothetical protein n=1 Tax=Pseudoalteromonas sp. C2R02 TaxID=2841565 RepID=UPI001C084397|nr:hypothetical protein [Pseudoalteromonas sp. C2R02]MBU2969071.1 hypothetical protein [Pseudoalteromonas sp. C2R02]